MPTLQSINASASPEVQMNQNFYAVAAAALFGRKDSTTTGLTLGLYGGIIGGIGTFSTIADTTVALTASQTNYVEATTAGAVSANTSAFTAGRQPLYIAVTNASAITTLTDYRVILPSMSTGAVTYSTLTLATGTITASTPALSVTQTWNNAAVAFIAKDTNITNTASDAASMLERWRVGGAVKASIDYLGAMVLAAGLTAGGAITANAGAVIAASQALTGTAANSTISGFLSVSATNFLANTTTTTAFAGATALLTIGGTGASSVFAIPGTKTATNSTTASVTLSGGLAVADNVFVGNAVNATTGTFTNVGGTLSTATQGSVTSMAALATVGTITSGVWDAGAVTSSTTGTFTGASGGLAVKIIGRAADGYGILGFYANNGTTLYGSFEAASSSMVLRAGTSAGLDFYANTGSAYAGGFDSSGNWSFNTKTLAVGAITSSSSISGTAIISSESSTTGTAAVFDGSNHIRPLTSSLRFKHNVREWQPDAAALEAFLATPEIMWDYNENGATDVLGLGAESLYAIDRNLVNLDKDGLAYSNRDHSIMAYMKAIIRKQGARLTALEAAIKQ